MKERPEWDLNPDLCNTGAVLHQLSCQVNWELVMWVYDKSVGLSPVQAFLVLLLLK